MSSAVLPRRRVVRRPPARDPAIASVLAFEATTLAVFSSLHLAGVLHITGSSRATGAGFAEAVICLVLLAGAWAVWRAPETGRPAALAAVGFAIFGFIVGLTFTVSAGAPVDLAYHVVMLLVLIATALLIARGPRDKMGD